MTKKTSKRKLSMLLIAIMFVASASMTPTAISSEISGVTPTGNTFNITPEKFNGDSGYRSYAKFNLDAGDVANLDFINNINRFVNLVDNQVQINGLVNTVRNGAFHNGEAVFVSPNGMIVGPSGVLNVGALSVYTPTPQGMKLLKNGIRNGNYDLEVTNLGQKQTVDGVTALSYHGNAPITINGKVISRGDVNLVANTFTLGQTGGIAAGVADNGTLVTTANAASLFNDLVNTGSTRTANVEIRSYDRANLGPKAGGIHLNGTLTNKGAGNIILENRGSNGLNTSGNISNTKGQLHLVNAKGTMTLGGNITGRNDVATERAINIVNGPSAGLLTVTGTVDGTNGVNVYNRTAQGANIGGTIRNNKDLSGSARGLAISNERGALNFTGKLENNNNAILQITNKGNKLALNNIDSTGKIVISNEGADGMDLNGTIKNSGNTAITNWNGKMTVNGTVQNVSGKMNLTNEGNGGLLLADTSRIVGSGDEVLIQNVGAGQGQFQAKGSIKNNGATYLQNTKNAMSVDGSIDNKTGVLYIGNTGSGLTIEEGANISNNASIQVYNKGANGLTVNGAIANSSNGGTALTNRGGSFVVNGTILSDKGNMNLTNVGNGDKGLTIANTAKVGSKNGELLVQNTGSNGLKVNGEIDNKGNTTLYNKAGNFNVATTGKVKTTDGTLYLSNAGSAMDVRGSVSALGEKAKLNILNTGANGMNLDGIIAAEGKTLVTNKAGDMNVDGIIATKDNLLAFSNHGNGALNIKDGAQVLQGEKGNIHITNAGAGGMNIDGLVDNSVGELLVTNKAGDLNVKGNVTNRGGKLNINNKGDGALNVAEDAMVTNEGLGRTYLTNKGAGGMKVDGDVVGGGHILVTNREGGMNISSKVTSTKDNVVLTNTGNENMVVNGTVRGNKVTAYAQGNDIVLGNTETKQIAINGLKKVFITADDGSIKNAGVDTHVIKSGGNLYMATTNGSIGEDVDTTGVGPNSRDLTKSVNVYVDGKVKAFTTDEKNASVINIASKGKDLKVDRIKADGKVILLTDKTVDENGVVRTGSILNAATELGDYANVKGTTVHMISSGSVGADNNALHFRQTDATKQSNVVAVKNVNLHARGEDAGEDVYFGVIKSKEGSVSADMIRNGVVENAIAPNGVNIKPRKNDANFQVKNISNNPNIIKDYFDVVKD